jgi:two-component system OmpR family sensor kinase
LSIRRRLLAAIVAVAMAALLAAGALTWFALRSFLLHRVDQSLDSASAAVEQALHEPNGRRAVPQLDALAGLVPGLYVQLRAPDGSVQGTLQRRDFDQAVAGPRLPASLPDPGDRPGSAVNFNAPPSSSEGESYRVRVSSLPGGGELVVGQPLTDVTETLHRLVVVEVGVTAVALAVVTGLGMWLVRLGLRPLDQIETTAAAIADGELSRRVEFDDPRTEVGRLGRALNVMLSRIEAAFAERRASEDRLRRFVADASHELRTPLAAVRAYAELFRRGADRRPDDLARAMTGIETESARMSSLVDELLLLARLDQGRPLELRPLDLTGVAEAAVDAARTVAPDRPLVLEAVGPINVRGDSDRLRQVIDNLLANVRAHTPPDTPAIVRVKPEGDAVVLEVADRGPGMDADTAAHVFERFYRADPSRSRARGGVGLGLAIVAAIAEAHGGRATVSSVPGAGSTFRVTLPAAAAPARQSVST